MVHYTCKPDVTIIYYERTDGGWTKCWQCVSTHRRGVFFIRRQESYTGEALPRTPINLRPFALAKSQAVMPLLPPVPIRNSVFVADTIFSNLDQLEILGKKSLCTTLQF